MRKISTVGLFCCDKFEEIPKQKVIDLAKFKKGMGTKQSTKHKLEENQYYYSENPI